MEEKKTPDKICVSPHQITDYDLEIQEVGHNGAEEYIRKEALLEWLIDEMDKSEKFSTCEHYSNVIEHLEKM